MLKRSPCPSLRDTPLAVILMSVLVVICGAIQSSAQTPQPSATPQLNLDSTNDFHPLFERRERLIEEVHRLEQVVAELNNELSGLPSRKELEKELARLQAELEKEQKLTNADEGKVEAIQGYIADTNEKLEIVGNAPKLQDNKDLLYAQRRQLAQVEQKIASLFDDKRDVSWFRAISTVVVGLLIAVVVGGFYAIAWQKDGIAAKIFGGEMGMQFVTLFLIVIAIILFGIMGTLEGRELAALLGGLSGYILGKASVKVDTTRPNESNQGQNQDQNQNQQEQQQNQQDQNQG